MTKNKLAAYAQNLLPTLRKVEELKEIVKEFKKTNLDAIAYQEAIKSEQDAFKVFLDGSDIGSVLEEIKELGKDLKEGYEAAVTDSEYDAKDYAAFLKARVKDAVENVVTKGQTFDSLNTELL